MTNTRPEIRFRPRRKAPAQARRRLFLAGPLLWLVGLVVIAFVTHHRSAIEYALVILAASFALSLIPLSLLRAARVREERSP
ncbi:MAG TPA: hypothetical protein VH108_07345 [Gaiellaceae bacterium]|nr:hypothetical protein [Gaiellaceae bacterium]